MTIRFPIVLLLFFVWLQIAAQQNLTLPNYRQYTLRDGLSQMQVLCMLQDSRGYIWIGTKEGLNCFNGDRFLKFTDKNGLADDYIYQLLEDKSGKIWVSTYKGIACFDGEKIEAYTTDKLITPGIALDNDGKIWYYGRDEKFNGDFGYLEEGKYISKIENFKPENTVFQIGLLFFIPNENRFFFHHIDKWYTYKDGIFKPVGETSICLPFQSSTGRFYLVSENAEGWIVNEVVNGKPEQRAIVKNGKYVMSTLTETVTLNNFIRSTIYEFKPDTFRANTNPEILSSAMLTDRDGTQWFGTEEGVYNMFGEGFTTFSRQFLPTVWGITEDLQGTIWFASFTLGLKKLKEGVLSTVNLPDPKMGYNLYFHPSVDKRGRIFFPNYNGLLVVDGGKITQHTTQTAISTFYEPQKDLLFTGDHDTVKIFTPDLSLVRKLTSNDGLQVGANVLSIQKDKNGQYWFAGGRGLARYDWDLNKIFSYNKTNGRFNSVGAWVIHNDYYKRTWFGTKQGLYWYDNETDSLKKFEEEELAGSVNLLASIDSTWLIASQPYGIYLLDLQKYYKTGKTELYLYNEKNGFLGIEPGQDGAFTDSKGNVWMTSSTEVVKLDPKKLKTRNHTLNVRIDKFNGKKLPFHSNTIELVRNQNSVVVTFDAICFNRPNPVEYSWKLGTDTLWSPWQTEDYAVLSELPDGNTGLTVRARLKGLPLERPAIAETYILVSMALYRQPWFLPVLFAIISLAGIIFLTLALLQMKRASREAKVFQVQAIQSQMNPHFIFNVLASLQTMILNANISKANDYLVKLADLMRSFLEASAGTGTIKSPQTSDGQVTLASEIKMIAEFVDFQQVINPGKFDFEIVTDEKVIPENELIPPMLIQPFAENAIRHGLLQAKHKGLLMITFCKSGDALIIEISDNGVGIEKAGQLLQRSAMRYTSRGKELTLNRIYLLNQLGFKIGVETKSNSRGTNVTITIQK